MRRKYQRGKALQVGDILNVKKGRSPLAMAISFFMRIYKKKLELDEDMPDYHHSGLIIEVWDHLYVAEAVGKGFKIHPVETAYSPGDWENRVDVTRPNFPLNENEKKRLCRVSVGYSMTITRYDIFNFIFQAILVLTGKWIGPTGKKAQNRVYCSEAVATIYNQVRHDTFRRPEATNPIDVAINENFHAI